MRTPQPSDPVVVSMPFEGGDVFYTDTGSGPCVLALHGCPGSVRDWRWLGSPIEAKARLIRIDLPGFGKTPLSTFPSASFSDRAAWVVRFMSALGIDEFVVMGHSAGGPLAMEIAAAFPDTVKGLALIAAPGFRPHRPLREHPVPRLMSGMLRIPGLRWAVLPWIRWGFERAGFPKGIALESIRQSIHIVVELDFDRQISNAELMQCPCLVAWSDDDTFIDSDISQELARGCPPGPRLNFIDGTHYIQKTQSMEIAASLCEWLEIL